MRKANIQGIMKNSRNDMCKKTKKNSMNDINNGNNMSPNPNKK